MNSRKAEQINPADQAEQRRWALTFLKKVITKI